jgi:hypothetical protein
MLIRTDDRQPNGLASLTDASHDAPCARRAHAVRPVHVRRARPVCAPRAHMCAPPARTPARAPARAHARAAARSGARARAYPARPAGGRA